MAGKTFFPGMEAYLSHSFHRRPLVPLGTCFQTTGWPPDLYLDWIALLPAFLATPKGTYWSTAGFNGLIWARLDRLISERSLEGISPLTTGGKPYPFYLLCFETQRVLRYGHAAVFPGEVRVKGNQIWGRTHNVNSTLEKQKVVQRGLKERPITLKWQYKDLVEKARRHFLSGILCRQGGIHSTCCCRWSCLRIQRRGLCGQFWHLTSLASGSHNLRGLSCFGTHSGFMVLSFPFMVGGWLDNNRRDNLLLVDREVDIVMALERTGAFVLGLSSPVSLTHSCKPTTFAEFGPMPYICPDFLTALLSSKALGGSLSESWAVTLPGKWGVSMSNPG